MRQLESFCFGFHFLFVCFVFPLSAEVFYMEESMLDKKQGIKIRSFAGQSDYRFKLWNLHYSSYFTHMYPLLLLIKPSRMGHC